MSRPLRRLLSMHIDHKALDEDDVLREFAQRGRFDWFRLDGHLDSPPVEDLMDFIHYFAFDAEGNYNGFSYAWRVAIAVCQDTSAPVRLTIDLLTFAAQAKALRAAGAKWPDWERLLGEIVVERLRPSG